MNPLAIGALAGGTYLVYREVTKDSKAASDIATDKKRPAQLDPGMDEMISEAVTLAVKSETDPQILSNLATLLTQAGYPNSAAAVSAAAKKGTST